MIISNSVPLVAPREGFQTALYRWSRHGNCYDHSAYVRVACVFMKNTKKAHTLLQKF